MNNFIKLSFSLLLTLFFFSLNAQDDDFYEHINHSQKLPFSEAIDYLDNIITTSKEPIPPKSLALFQHQKGIYYYYLGDYQQAIKSTQAGKKIREQLTDIEVNITEDLSRSYNNLLAFYGQLFRMNKIFSHTDSCIFYAEKIITLGKNRNPNYINAYKGLAVAYEHRGDYNKSLNYYITGIQSLQAQDSLTTEKERILAQLYFEKAAMLNTYQPENANENLLEEIKYATSVFERLGLYIDLALCYEQAANIYATLNQHDKSVNLFKKSIKLYQNLLENNNHTNNTEEEALGARWNNFGNFYLELKKYDEAEKCFQAALQIKEARLGKKNHPEKAAAYVNLGEVHHNQKNYQKAVALYHQSISNYLLDFKTKNLSAQPNQLQLKKCPDKANLLYTLGKKAEVLADIDDDAGNTKNAFNALQTLRTADRLIDIMRADHAETQSKLFWREKTRDIYEQALSLAFKSNKPKDAFYFFEKSKSILLLDAMKSSNARQLLPNDLANEEMRLLRVKDSAREASTTNKTKHIDYILMSDSLTEFRAELAKKYPRYYQARYDVEVAKLNENAPAYSYQNNTEYIHFFYGKNHIYSLRFGAGKSKLVRTVRTPQTDDLIKKYLHQFSSPNVIVNDYEAYNNTAFKVYELLLKPLFENEELPEELVLLPDDFLNVLPFDALKTKVNSKPNEDYLIQKTNIRYAYSINVLKNQKSIDNQVVKILGMAPFAETKDSLSLNNSAKELEAAKDYGQGLFSKGETATHDFFLKNADDYQFLHLSTHAHEQGKNGNPEIFFADKNLELSQLYSTEFNHNLIILSACETGLGEVKKGEGVLSLNRGFTYAGAQSIISSLWRVNDKSTSDILGHFYANLDEKTTKSKALQLAKKDLLQNGDALNQSPYYWAGLTYSGSDNTVILEHSSTWKFFLLGGLICVALGLLFWVFYKRRNKKEILPSPIPFLQQIFVEMQIRNADFTSLTIDHLCYRVETQERYLELKEVLSKQEKLLNEKLIGGRPIATFKFAEPFIFQDQKIYLVELPAPKLGRFYPEGWEHFEMVITTEFKEFMQQYPYLNFDTKAITKKVNPEVRLTFPSGSVKFHHYPLDYVIEYLD